MNQLVVYKGRTNIVPVSLGYDVSNDTIVSEIRVEKNRESELIATWSISFLNDGTDGELILTLDDSETEDVVRTIGYMDIKRISNGEPLNVLDDVIEVLIKEPITA